LKKFAKIRRVIGVDGRGKQVQEVLVDKRRGRDFGSAKPVVKTEQRLADLEKEGWPGPQKVVRVNGKMPIEVRVAPQLASQGGAH
jgi:hypothetical protein